MQLWPNMRGSSATHMSPNGLSILQRRFRMGLPLCDSTNSNESPAPREGLTVQVSQYRTTAPKKRQKNALLRCGAFPSQTFPQVAVSASTKIQHSSRISRHISAQNAPSKAKRLMSRCGSPIVALKVQASRLNFAASAAGCGAPPAKGRLVPLAGPAFNSC